MGLDSREAFRGILQGHCLSDVRQLLALCLIPGSYRSLSHEHRMNSSIDSQPIPVILETPEDGGNVYEDDTARNMYLDLHYPRSGQVKVVDSIFPQDCMPPAQSIGFPQRVAELLIRLQPKCMDAALDVGCAVGGSSFALAKAFQNVDAFDFSRSFIDTAIGMKNHEQIVFQIPIEADIHQTVVALHEPGVIPDLTSRVHFFVGDACQLSQMKESRMIRTGYDGILLSNLLCRLPDPRACLDALAGIINPGGVVLIVTPFSWLEQFTPRANWLGGYYADSNSDSAPVQSDSVLREIMEGNGFDFIHKEQIPLLIREHQRKYQYIISEATGWRMRE